MLDVLAKLDTHFTPARGPTVKDVIVSGASPMLMPREDPVGKIVFAVVVLVIGIACFVALVTFLAAVLRERTLCTKHAIERAPLRSLLVGFAGYAVLFVAASWFYSRAFIERLLETEIVPGMLIASATLAGFAALASLLGAPGLFSYVGDRLAVVHGGQVSGIKRLVLATLISVLAMLFPVLGWFVIAPVLLAMSFGGLLAGFIIGR